MINNVVNLDFKFSNKVLVLLNVSQKMVMLLNPNEPLIPDKIRAIIDLDPSGYFQQVYPLNPMDIKIEKKIEYGGRALQLYIKSSELGSYSDTWLSVENWKFDHNPEILVDGIFDNSGIMTNSKEFELIFSDQGICAFFKKGTKEYDFTITRAMDNLVFQTSSKTIKRKSGNIYLFGNSRKIFLGEFQLGKSDKVYMYSKEIGKYKSIEELIKDKINTFGISYLSENDSDCLEQKTFIFKKNCKAVDYGFELESLSKDFDIRSLWVPYARKYKEFLETSEKFKESIDFSKCNEAQDFFDIFLFSPLGSTIDDNRKWITPEIREVGEKLLGIFLKKRICSNLNPQPIEISSKPRSFRTHVFRDDESIKGYYTSKLSDFLSGSVLKNSSAIGYFDRTEIFSYLIKELFQIDTYNLVEQAISEVKTGIMSMRNDLRTYRYWISRIITLDQYDVNHNRLTFNQVSEFKSKAGYTLLSKNYVKIENFDFFNKCSHLKNIILKIFSEAVKFKGVSFVTNPMIREIGTKTNNTRVFSCQIQLSDIINYFGGIDKIPEELEQEILDQEFTVISIMTNNNKFELL